MSDSTGNEVWPGLVVAPSSLYDAVAQLRRVLGPDHTATAARKGYRPVTPVLPASALPTTAASAAPPHAAGAEVDGAGTEPAQSRLGARSVAVLPFGTHWLPGSLSFLGESLTGGLIAELSRQPGLAVIARGTMLNFGQRPASPPQVARELGARFELNDLARQAGVVAGDVDVRARAFAAQAWVQLFARAQATETNEKAAALATQARGLAPQLAQAWMCGAYCDWRAGQYRWGDEPREVQLTRALSRAERAVELDPRDPDAHYVLSLAARQRERRLRSDEARAHCSRAFALSPLEPLRVIWHAVQVEALLVTGDARRAYDKAQRGMAVNPTYAQVYIFGAAAAWRLGAAAQARDWVAALRGHKAFSSLAAVRTSLGVTYDVAARGQLEQWIELLREAGLPAQ